MKRKSLLLQLTGDMPLFRIIDFLVDNKGFDYSKKDIAEGAGIARASLFNYWPELEKREIVKITRRFGKTRLYTLNSHSPITKKILELEATLIRQALEKAKPRKVLA
jgi:hypothetical protein